MRSEAACVHCSAQDLARNEGSAMPAAALAGVADGVRVHGGTTAPGQTTAEQGVGGRVLGGELFSSRSRLLGVLRM